VRKGRSEKALPPIGPWILRSASGADQARFDKPSEFAGALRKAMSDANAIELLFAIWEQNVDTVRALNRSPRQEQLSNLGIAPQLVNHLKRCAIALVKPESRANGSRHRQVLAPAPTPMHARIDKSVLNISEQTHPLNGASPLHRQPTLPNLRTHTLTRSPHPLRPNSRA
jgi:hypothetical protein